MEITSSAFAAGGPIPGRHTCDGENLSPPLAWTAPPAGTRSLALVCADPDAPAGTWYHWAIYDIPATLGALAEGLPGTTSTGACRQGRNDFGKTGYGGPCPPRGHGPHRYAFRLMALDVARLGLAAGDDCRTVEQAARRHLLAEAVLVGTYERPGG